MKHVYSIILLTFLFIGCSSDDSPETEQNQVLSPLVSDVSTEIGNIGDVVTINGENFNPSADYTIKFNGVDGKINEITSSYIKVQIPAGSTSGDISLVYNGNNKIIGSIVIDSSKLYGYKYFDSGNEEDQIVEIDKTDGTTRIVAKFELDWSLWDTDLVLDRVSNLVYGFSVVSHYPQSIVSIDLNNGSISKVELDNASNNTFYESLTIGNDGKLYGIKFSFDSEEKQIVEIDKTNGKSRIVASLSKYKGNPEYIDLIFDKTNNKILALWNFMENGLSHESILSVDINDGSSSLVGLNKEEEDSWYDNLVVGKEGKLYAHRGSSSGYQIVEIDKTNGTDRKVITINGSILKPEFDSVNNRILAIYYPDYEHPNYPTQSILTINLNNSTTSFVDLNNAPEKARYAELILSE